MYVVVESHSGRVLAFGLTPKKADADFVRRDVWYDGPPLKTRRCSPALYRRLEALDRSGNMLLFFCRISRKGIAVCLKRMPSVTDPRAISRRRG
jgi:hypothetical protein